MKPSNKIDLQVGANIKTARTLNDISREKIAAHLGISQQAIEKYETGENRIAASTLVMIAIFLGCRVADLVHGVDKLIDNSTQPDVSLHKKTDQDMLRHYHKIESDDVQSALRNLTRAIVADVTRSTKAPK